MNDQHSNKNVPHMREMLYIFVTKHKKSYVGLHTLYQNQPNLNWVKMTKHDFNSAHSKANQFKHDNNKYVL